MARSRQTHDHEPTALERLADAGILRLPDQDLATVLAARGPLTGNVTRAGSDAVAEQRGDRA